MRILGLLIVIAIVHTSCLHPQDAQQIVDNAIKSHGVLKLEEKMVQFDFRKHHYAVDRRDGNVTYSRTFQDDSLGSVRDVITNQTDFQHFVNDQLLNISIDWQKRQSNSIHSVLYFFQLPYDLNDEGVKKEYLGKNIVNDQMYHKIKVTFDQENGGEYQDEVFVYWIHAKKYTIDFFGYSYHFDEGGIRFRQSINRRQIDGILFQDYINYKSLDLSIPVEDLDEFYETGQLEKVSVIANEKIEVSK